MKRSEQKTVAAQRVAAQSHPLPPRGKSGTILLGLAAMAVAIGGLGVWGSTAPIASAAVASGKFISSSKRRQVQHAEGGTIQTIHVRDGAVVRQGDVLVELDGQRVRSSHAIARIAYFDAVVSLARLRAALAGSKVITLPKFMTAAASTDTELKAMVVAQTTLLTALANEQEGQVRVLRQRIAQSKDQILGLEAERNAIVEQMEIASKELAVLRELSDKGYSTRHRMLKTLRENVQLKGRLGRLINRIAGAQKEIGATELEILQLEAKRKREYVAELRKIEHQLFDLKEKYLDAETRLGRLKVRAPAKGTVVESRVSTVGGVVRPGDTLMEIVPLQDRLIVEARLKPQDVDGVGVGQITEVRLNGLNQRTTPTLKGKVIYVSADSLTDNRAGDQYFAVHVAVNLKEVNQLADVELVPGMPADIMIKTGSRTAVAYLMRPLLDSMSRAWRED
ncbi:MAG: HlyD family type I secretion periplasmic adaptor subunit [Hyphomicrobiaceae bacterium]